MAIQYQRSMEFSDAMRVVGGPGANLEGPSLDALHDVMHHGASAALQKGDCLEWAIDVSNGAKSKPLALGTCSPDVQDRYPIEGFLKAMIGARSPVNPANFNVNIIWMNSSWLNKLVGSEVAHSHWKHGTTNECGLKGTQAPTIQFRGAH